MTQPRATRAQLETNEERAQDRQTGELRRHNDTVRPLLDITIMVNYFSIGRRAEDKDPGTAPIEMEVEITEDA